MVWLWDKDAFGTNAANNQPDGFDRLDYNLRFPGQIFDGLAGLHYNMARDYDPAVGRYIEPDPIGLKGGIDPYGYVEDNPMGSADPLGLVKRGSGWSGPQWASIKQAENRIRQQLSKACSCTRNGGTSCIPCEVAHKLLNALNN
jgi:RHS repeat-associated protein